ncbi:LysR family transcriptional regulator, glycine cleavage system transcriptional activator [Collimonas sp. OK607]|uniref:LysR substrate-binding domain-containing protein n=1 Tax=Collimonas sp. OK607 TaxID=1798194 RepID=UPI0008F25002|nr:LysR substrate-binding domain-containing protein [Collimonas sp. OK607]SFB18815.1 LysR family transcriptional regulator, glycine cleavage system transcriptional activator [Collimonas sp. OK607]
MKTRLPPLKPLRVFEAVVRTGSLTLAAAELHLTHSAVSQQIKLLEQHFDQTLFVRGQRGVEPTAAARVFFADVKAGLDRISLAAEQLLNTGKVRIIRVSCTPSMAMRWLIPRLSSFQIEHPRVEIRVTTSTVAVDALKEPFDVLIRRSPMHRAEYECVRFLDDVLTPVASPRYLQQHPCKTPDDLLQASLLHLSTRSESWTRWFSEAGVPVKGQLSGQIYEHFFLSLQAALTDLGVALGSLAMIEEDLAHGSLAPLFPDLLLRDKGFHLLYRPSHQDPALTDFIAWLQLKGKQTSTSIIAAAK